MGVVIHQYEVFLVALDPTVGHEIKKSRPCAVISPDELNLHIATVLIAPMTTQSRPYPSRVPVLFSRKNGWVVLDQIRAVDKRRLIKRLGRLEAKTVARIKSVIQEMLVE